MIQTLPRSTRIQTVNEGGTTTGARTATEVARLMESDLLFVAPDAAHTARPEWHARMVVFTAGCTVTIPADLPDGFSCGWSQDGADPITFVAGDGVTLQSHDDALESAGQYLAGALAKWGTATYRLLGSLA